MCHYFKKMKQILKGSFGEYAGTCLLTYTFIFWRYFPVNGDWNKIQTIRTMTENF